MKLKCDEPLSNVAFNFNVRRYNKAFSFSKIWVMAAQFEVRQKRLDAARRVAQGGAVQVDSIKTRVEGAPDFCA